MRGEISLAESAALKTRSVRQPRSPEPTIRVRAAISDREVQEPQYSRDQRLSAPRANLPTIDSKGRITRPLAPVAKRWR